MRTLIIFIACFLSSCTNEATGLLDRGMVQRDAGDYKGALQSLTQSAELGNVLAMQNLAALHLEEKSGVFDAGKGEYWFLQCANKGELACQEMLGLLYWVGYGKAPDLAKASHWLNIAANNGSAQAKLWIEDSKRGKKPSKGISS